MFTDYYEWFGVAAVLLMLLYNGQRGSGHKQLVLLVLPSPCVSALRRFLPCFITC